jgi:hypothetical protein
MARRREPVLAHERFAARRHELANLPPRDLFTEIWRSNLWGAAESRSGLGSEQEATSQLTAKLPPLLQRFAIRTLLDLPCGDFAWLKPAEFDLDVYVGADIVDEIIALNTARHATADGRISFRQLDLLTDPLPSMDAVLCRDCLVHLSFANIARAFANLAAGGSRWLIATTFTDHHDNRDITDGDWRLLNLQGPPFNLPPPEALLNEDCREAGGTYDDKSLGVWRIADLGASQP